MSLEGASVWSVLVVMAFGTWKLAERFFTPTSTKTKLFVFFALLGFYGLMGAIVVFSIKNLEWTNAPVPSSANSTDESRINILPLVSDAMAQESSGWIYCGDYDGSQWLLKNLDVPEDKAPSDLIGQRLTTNIALDLYDEAPQFSIGFLQWRIGQVVDSIPASRTVTVIEAKSFGKQRVWCKVERR